MMLKYYKLTVGTVLEYQDGELTVVNMETGFAATGNKHAYQILKLMEAPITVEDIIEDLCKKYQKSQHLNIIKSIPNIIQWSLERGIIENVSPPV